MSPDDKCEHGDLVQWCPVCNDPTWAWPYWWVYAVLGIVLGSLAAVGWHYS